MTSQAQPTIVEDPALITPQRVKRFWLLVFLLWSIIGLLLGRSIYLQLVKGYVFRQVAEGNRVALLPLPAPRGIIYDRFHQPLVVNVSNTDLVIDPTALPNEEDEQSVRELLGTLLPQLRVDFITDTISKARSEQKLTLLHKAIDHSAVLAIEERLSELPGIRLLSSLVRQYPYADATAHLLGYTSIVSSEERRDRPGLLPTDATGKTGIEKQFEHILTGQHGGMYTEVDAAGRLRKNLGQREPMSGSDVNLTIDMEWQRFIYNLFAEQDAKRQKKEKKSLQGAVVALDPNTGSVLAMVSYPAFNPNSFSQPALQADAEKLFSDTRKPMFNRTTSGLYPPGSVIKPLLAAAALQEGLISETTTINSSGGIKVGSWFFPDWKEGGHGPTDVKRAIAESVNTFFYLVSGGDATHRGLGVRRITQYLEIFGWGKQTGIDLPAESDGFLPSTGWKEKITGEPWYIGDTYHLGIGQGQILVTPLQVSVATAALANGQYLPIPHVLAKQAERHRLPIDPKHLATVRAGMRQVITHGSGRRLNNLIVPIAGKTGTAQAGNEQENHAWFTSFGPYDSPQVAITVLLEHGGEGDKQAIPFAQEIWQWWIENRSNQSVSKR